MSTRTRRFRKHSARILLVVIPLGIFWLIGTSVELNGQVPPVIPAPPVMPLQPPFTLQPPMVYPSYVQNPIIPEPSPFPDGDLLRTIRNLMAADSLLHKAGIRVNVHSGIAVLSGTAETSQDLFRASADAYAAGARFVDNQLRVRSP